jgi:hypothetical protein
MMSACLPVAKKNSEGIWGTLGDKFLFFSQKNMDGEGIWGTLEDALTRLSLPPAAQMLSAAAAFISKKPLGHWHLLPATPSKRCHGLVA